LKSLTLAAKVDSRPNADAFSQFALAEKNIMLPNRRIWQKRMSMEQSVNKYALLIKGGKSQ
jgi:hypothetical protein